jgi:transcriptional regulator with XRE-family HTH domain
VPREIPEWIQLQRRNLGDRIRLLRDTAGLTQQDIVEMTGIDRRTYQRIERGTSDPRYSDLLLIARALEMPLSDLVRGGQDKTAPPPK